MSEKTYTFEGLQPLSLSFGQYVEDEDGNLTPHPEYVDRYSLELMLKEGDELPPVSLADRFTITITTQEK